MKNYVALTALLCAGSCIYALDDTEESKVKGTETQKIDNIEEQTGLTTADNDLDIKKEVAQVLEEVAVKLAGDIAATEEEVKAASSNDSTDNA